MRDLPWFYICVLLFTLATLDRSIEISKYLSKIHRKAFHFNNRKHFIRCLSSIQKTVLPAARLWYDQDLHVLILIRRGVVAGLSTFSFWFIFYVNINIKLTLFDQLQQSPCNTSLTYHTPV